MTSTTYYTCLKKHKEGNRILGYTLIEEDGGTPFYIQAYKLKKYIKEGSFAVTNLTLSSDGKLRENKHKQKELSPKKIEERNAILRNIASAKLMGKAIEIPTACKHTCILVETDSYNHILYIPDDVEQLNHSSFVSFTKYIRNLKGNLTVIGGNSLKDANEMFDSCKIQSIDFTHFVTDNIKMMSGMFRNCCVQALDLSSFNTERVIDMSSMFEYCLAKTIELSSFNTPCLRQVVSMFCYCHAQTLDLSSLNTHQVINMAHMLEGCYAKEINFGHFDTSQVQNMQEMFRENKASKLDLSMFDTSHVINMGGMFLGCNAQIINLESFNTKACYNMNCMFNKCEAVYLNLVSFSLSNICNSENMFSGCLAKKILISMDDENLRSRILSGKDVPKTTEILVRKPK